MEEYDTFQAAKAAADDAVIDIRWFEHYGWSVGTGQTFRIRHDWMSAQLVVPTEYRIERYFRPSGWFVSKVVPDE
jgi:hypothetical protein